MIFETEKSLEPYRLTLENCRELSAVNRLLKCNCLDNWVANHREQAQVGIEASREKRSRNRPDYTISTDFLLDPTFKKVTHRYYWLDRTLNPSSAFSEVLNAQLRAIAHTPLFRAFTPAIAPARACLGNFATNPTPNSENPVRA